MNILFMGPPGSGKGTQSELVRSSFGLTHLSTGDMFRQAIKDQSESGLKAKAFMDRGAYVPDEIVIELIRGRLRQPDCKSGFILDGFPRTENQAKALALMLHDLGLALNFVFFFNVEQEVLVERLSARRVCRKCGRIVSSTSGVGVQDPTPCAKGSGEGCDFFQRDDDRPEVVANRIEVYKSQTTPVLSYYQSRQMLVTIDGTQTPAAVFRIIEQKLKTLEKNS